MVFASYNSASYLLPLDNDQSVAFYRNENRLFPTAIGPGSAGGVPPPPGRGNGSNAANDMSITDMLTAAYHHEMQQHHQPVGGVGGGGAGGAGGGGGGASVGNIATGDCPFGRVQSPAAQQHPPQHLQQQQQQQQFNHRFGGTVAMCDDFQPIAYLNGSSNGYYGFVPSLASTGGEGGGRGQPSNNNVLPGSAGNNNRPHHHPPATAANVNGHLSALHFHGNERNHISCNDDAGEQNNNNNNGEGEGMFHVHPLSGQHLVRKRKESAPNQHELDEAMDTNVLLAGGHQHPKRRKTIESEQNWMGGAGYAVAEGVPFPGSNGVLYQHQVEIHEPAVDEMECQDQHLSTATVNGLQAVTAAAGQQQPTSKIQRRNDLLNSSDSIGSSTNPTGNDDRVTPTTTTKLLQRLPGFPGLLHRPTCVRFECDKSGQGADLDLFHSLHGTGGGFSIGK